MTSRKLTVHQIGETGRAAIRNAVDLIDAARLLASDDHVPSAFALAILAFEEFGKFTMCRSALLDWRRGERLTVHELRARFRGSGAHGEKQSWAYAHFAVMNALAGGAIPAHLISQFVAEDQRWKQRALYVDLRDDGDIESPDDVPKSDALTWIEAAAGLLEPYRKIGVPSIADLEREAQSPRDDGDELNAVADLGDPAPSARDLGPGEARQ